MGAAPSLRRRVHPRGAHLEEGRLRDAGANGQIEKAMFARDLASGRGKPAQLAFRELTLAAFGQK